MKQSITAPNYAVNNVSNLPDIVKNQATTVKTTFDKASVDIKAYETNLIAELNGNNGSKKIGHNSLNIASDNVGDAIEEVYQAITSTVLGEIPDNSITNNKLAIDAKVGSVASLTTAEKSTVVGAINEIDAYVNGVPEQVGTVETNLNILRTAKVTTGSNVALAVDTDGTFDMTRNGNTLTVIPNVANTGAMTIAVDGQTARAIQKANDAGTLVALEAGDIKQNVPIQLVLQTSGTPVFIYAPKGGSNIKSIQRGMTSLSSATTVDVSISPVDVNNSIILLNLGVASSLVPANLSQYLTTVEFVNSTTIRLTKNTLTNRSVCVWQVVEFKSAKSKQIGTKDTTGAIDNSDDVTISSVNIGKCILVAYPTTTYTGAITTEVVAHRYLLSSDTKISFIRGSVAATLSYKWQLLEFN